MVEVTFHENELDYCESELGNSGGCCSSEDTHKKSLSCDFGGKRAGITHNAFQKAVVAPLTTDRGHPFSPSEPHAAEAAALPTGRREVHDRALPRYTRDSRALRFYYNQHTK